MVLSLYRLFLSCVVLIPDSKIAEDEMTGEDEVMEVVLDRKLIQQISNAIDTRFLLQLVYHLANDFCIKCQKKILYHLF